MTAAAAAASWDPEQPGGSAGADLDPITLAILAGPRPPLPDPYDADYCPSRITERWRDLEGHRHQTLARLLQAERDPDDWRELWHDLEALAPPDPTLAARYRAQGARFLDSWRAAKVLGSLTFRLPRPVSPSLDTGEQSRTRRPRADTRKLERQARRELVTIAERRIRELGDIGPEAELWRTLRRRWRGCAWTQLYQNPATGTVVGLPEHCDAPLCPWCDRRRLGRIRDRFRERHDAALRERRVYFAVLTTPNVPLGQLAVTFDRLRKAVADLRRQRWFAGSIRGGAWRLELTVNLTTRTWHPHVNLVMESGAELTLATWQADLQRAWRELMGSADGEWVWLRPGWQATMREAVKRQVAWQLADPEPDPGEDPHGSALSYTTKPIGPAWIDAADPAWVAEYVTTQRNRRQLSAWGEWRGIPEPPAEHDDEATIWAPEAPGDPPWVQRRLPESDPITGDPDAAWEWIGVGPRWYLTPAIAAGARTPWLTWTPVAADPDPTAGDDDDTHWAPLRLVLGSGP